MKTIKIQKAFATGKEKFVECQTDKQFMTAIIDPDWPYTVAPGMKSVKEVAAGKGKLSGFTRNKDGKNQYKQATPLSIDDLKKLPVAELVGGYVMLWTVGPFLINGNALAILDAWGFQPVSILTWAKWNMDRATWDKETSPTGGGYGGVGFWFLGNAEFVIVAKKPDMPSIRTGKSSLIVAPKGEHSAKPFDIHDLCETRFPGPYLELYGRAARKGWTVLGDEAPGDEGNDIRASMNKLIWG